LGRVVLHGNDLSSLNCCIWVFPLVSTRNCVHRSFQVITGVLALHHRLMILHVLSVLLLLGCVGLHHIILLLSSFIGMSLVLHSKAELEAGRVASELGSEVLLTTTCSGSCSLHDQKLLLLQVLSLLLLIEIYCKVRG
jgi:hypothetical protein